MKPSTKKTKLINWPIVRLKIKYPICSSGARKYSAINLKVEYKIRNKDDNLPGIINFCFFWKKIKIKNNTNPSRIASYICEGWRYKLSIKINWTPQGTDVSKPYSSELIKFAILPKKIPIGATNATISKYLKTLSPFFLKNKCLQRQCQLPHHEKTFLLAKFLIYQLCYLCNIQNYKIEHNQAFHL